MTVLVGHPPRPNDRSAISYGAMLARSQGMALHVVSVVPAPWPTLTAGNTDKEYAAWSSAQGAAAVAAAQTVLGEVAADLETTAESVAGRSVASALVERARGVGASLVVVGSSHTGAWDRVWIGSTGLRLLHSSPLPVAVSTRGFATHAVPRFARATCAYRADRESADVLRGVAEICVESGAALRVATFGVHGRTMYPPEVRGEDDVAAAFVEQARAAQATALTGLTAPADVDTVVSVGRDWGEAVTRLDWRHDDILVLGSGTGGLLARVLLGSNAIRIVRHSPVPVVVVPET
jgi:nucleotide-binding universal stress UspA family protein